MLHFFDQLYATTDFMPHGDCLVWNPALLWLHAGSDVVTGIAYYLIAAILFYFILKRRDVPFFWVFLLFGAFILSCGTTHFMSAWTIYYPSYWIEGGIKTINAVISFGTAIVLIPLMPKLLALPSLKSALDNVALLNKDLTQKIHSLEEEIQKRKKAEEENWSLEAQLRQAHKMEAIGTLAGGIAHDFNNILAAILGYANLAKVAISEESPAKDKIEEVLKAANRAKDLVKHILSFSHKGGQEKLPVDVCHIVKDSLKLLRASIPTSIRIIENIEEDCGGVMADPTQAHQIVMNLCTNAFQAMEEDGGVLTVNACAVELTTDDLKNRPDLQPGGYIRLTVHDTGSGIESGNIDKIFDPYFTTKGIGKGSGMGLAVVAGIVRSHDGIIEVDSTQGQGTTFRVYLPQTEREVQHLSEKIDDSPTGNERILLVDDEASVADVTKQRVEQLGYRVTAKTSSEEALTLFREQAGQFDLVITDQTMPGLTGEKFSQELLKIRPDLPIIICSGYSSKMDAEKANLIGISAFIMKPADMIELAVTIRRVLDARTQETQAFDH
jgi:signal transduction histidine kinase/CheY-like chemotaxis protein